MQVRDKICIVTGGTGGIGSAVTKSLLNHGAKFVAVFDLDNLNTRKKFDELKNEFGARVDFFACDVTSKAIFSETFKKVYDRFSTIDILINNAGVVNEIDPDVAIETNYRAMIWGTFFMIDTVGAHKGGKGGTVINNSSIMGLINGLLPVYCSTKHAVVSFTRTMDNSQYKNTKVKVIGICPGITETPLAADIMTKKLPYVELDPNIDPTDVIGKSQPPENVGDAAVKVIENGKSGEIWVVEENLPPYVVDDCPMYKTLRK